MTDFVALSGGIDSTALALYMPDATPIFTDTGWEFPAIYEQLGKFEAVTGRKIIRLNRNDESLPDYIRRSKFFPNHGARFCTRMFKIEPINQYLSDCLPATLNIGFRVDEPIDLRVGNLTEMHGLSIAYPLREAGITRIDCLRLCIGAGLLPRYPIYMARGGCVGCFYKRASEVKAMIYIAPDVIEALIELEEEVQGERGEFFYLFSNIGMSIRQFRENVLAQQEMFDIDEVYQTATDRSEMGAACGAFCNR